MANLNDSDIEILSNQLMFWDKDLQSVTSRELKSELLEWKRTSTRLIEKNCKPESLLETYTIADGDVFPDIKTLLHIGCTLPVTSSEAERSFSGLRRIKTYMRSTMNEERLSALALIHIHHSLSIDTKIVCEQFAARNKRRL